MLSAAILPNCVPALSLEKALLQFGVCASDETLAELETVLVRPKLDRPANRQARQAFVDGFRAHVATVVVAQAVTDCPDPKDNKFLALA